jgi:hypothetical protein
MKRRAFIEKCAIGSFTITLPQSGFATKYEKPDYNRCKQTWEKLCGNPRAYPEAFRYIHPKGGIGSQIIPIGTYKENLHEICSYLLSVYRNSKLIFATTTPVPEGEPGRAPSDVLTYNEAAREVLSTYQEIDINDLYGFTKPNFDAWVIRPGNVHYNPVGQTEQGKRVAQVIDETLNI